MKKAGFLLNGVALAGVLTMLLIGSEGRPAPLVEDLDADLAMLESDAARQPSSSSVGALAVAYLDRREPGLAQAVLDHHPELQGSELSYARSRVALARGDLDEARRLTAVTLASCEAPAAPACAPTLLGRTLRQASYLEALGRAGVTDPGADGAAAVAALAESSRSVRLAAR